MEKRTKYRLDRLGVCFFVVEVLIQKYELEFFVFVCVLGFCHNISEMMFILGTLCKYTKLHGLRIQNKHRIEYKFDLLGNYLRIIRYYSKQLYCIRCAAW